MISGTDQTCYYRVVKKTLLFPFLVVILLFKSCTTGHHEEYIYLKGEALGTFYSVTYYCPGNNNYHPDIRDLFDQVEASLSIYNPGSIITYINESETGGETDSLFRTVFRKSVEISSLTENAFDITVAPLVNAWGFGTTVRNTPGQDEIDSIMNFTGIDKVRLEGGVLVKDDPGIKLDMNAIAKGYMSDLVADFLESAGVKNYMVEVGGELRLKGENPQGNLWRIGIDKPADDPAPVHRELQEILHITDRAIATSGSYRRFFIEEGKKYSHTINPFTGYPVEHNLLSVTVVALTAMEADALATAFMVLGPEKSLQLAEETENIEVYLIYESIPGSIEVEYTNGFSSWLEEEP